MAATRAKRAPKAKGLEYGEKEEAEDAGEREVREQSGWVGGWVGGWMETQKHGSMSTHCTHTRSFAAHTTS